MSRSIADLLADTVLVCHVLIAVFVIGGLPLIVVGQSARWRWVNHPAFRLAHLAAIAVIAAEAWFGVVCPLTVLEMALRANAGATTYGGGFIEHWLGRLFYYQAPPWVFVLAYSAFALLVVATWWRFPPRSMARPRPTLT